MWQSHLVPSPAASPVRPTQRQRVLSPVSSPATLSPAIWLAVCSAAVDAMDHARRVSWALRLSPVGPTPPAGVPVTQLAVARFWCNLVDIADAQPPALQRLPPGALFFALGASGSATALVPEAVALE
jgi:hypothetical protein